MAYGRWLGVPSRWQFWAQASTVLPCAFVSAWVFQKINETSKLALEGPGLPAPVAKMWAASALVFDGSQPMPPGALSAMAAAAVVGVLYVVIEGWRERRALVDRHRYRPGLADRVRSGLLRR
jgi:hypothetical protein